jgi:hypothetical protein
MTVADGHAARVPESAAARSRLRRSASRFAFTTASGALLLSLIVFPAVGPTATASASGCGTNWTSRSTPPKTIRVYLTDQHRVVVKNFRSYVPMVMASGEFPSRMPMAVLEAGATAVKQYAWYYALKGNHRSGFRTSSGVCYEDRNDTTDQLFRPAAHPSAKQKQAVANTWGLTLRKGKRFFLTGYRAGSSSHCGADRDGWHLYERSAADCARNGWSREHIQSYYYAPRLNFVWNGAQVPPQPKADTSAPTVQGPEVEPGRHQPANGNVNLKLHWSATDPSGIRSYAVEEKVGGGAWHAVRLSSPHQTAVSVTARSGTIHRFRVRAKDKAGNRSDWVDGAGFTPQMLQSDAASLSGHWQESRDKSALGGDLSSTTGSGASARLSFRGSSIGVVGSRGPNFGRIRVFIDGNAVKTVDLWASKAKDRRVVFRSSWAAAGKHSITVQALGSKERPKVELDAFVLLH